MNDSNPHDETRDLREGSASAPVPTDPYPKQIGRYRIESVLGKGGFGIVFLALDEELDRQVAVKVPHPALVKRRVDADAYLAEARTVAGLDHPGILPVYDVGRTDDCPCYVVSKFIDGMDLAKLLRGEHVTQQQGVELIVKIAESLHYAHKQGLVHRDIKPGNILIDGEGKPYIVDFGLALREEDLGKGPRFAGTPAYMSPEQARGEGHRVDGRSDIYSLGAILYELLTGKRTVSAETQTELLKQITDQEIKPPRQHDDQIPKELERICLKALAKRAVDRHTTALDFADDLHSFLREADKESADGSLSQAAASEGTDSTHKSNRPKSTQVDSESPLLQITPKGLRSYDEHDADFFLDLIPGPRDRDGLPESLRFWKSRIEERDPDHTFSIGVIYGPSGCGKSSMVKAGLLPLLSNDVVPIYVESTPEHTETQLTGALCHHFPAFDQGGDLKQVIQRIRRTPAVTEGKKVLLVIDQFEQWLHEKHRQTNSILAEALRQCDGVTVQCILLVRDDFWLALSRFGMELEVDLVPGLNLALADLFDLPHAKRVMEAFGRSLGRLPAEATASKHQNEFISQAVDSLAEDERIICVRLALFTEMVKGKEWTPSLLREVGGISGIGIAFLEETFGAKRATPRYKIHHEAARSVLRSLLPASGVSLRGSMRSLDELRTASGYSQEEAKFDELMRILDGELRLISPASEESQPDEEPNQQTTYQLTHDYLVPGLREWLTRKQKETRKGQAELLLADRAAVWDSSRENRQLPSLNQFLHIRFLTDKKNWIGIEQSMMSRAARVHGFRAAVFTATLAIACMVGFVIHQAGRAAEAKRLVQGLLRAETAQVAAILDDLKGFYALAKDDLVQGYSQADADSNAKLHAALALRKESEEIRTFLRDRLLEVDPRQFPYVRDLLVDHQQEFLDSYWTVFRDAGENDNRRFLAACALAGYAPDSETWTDEDAAYLVRRLLDKIPEEQPLYRSFLAKIKVRLYPELKRAFLEPAARERQAIGAAKAFAEFAVDDPGRIADVASEATVDQWKVLIDALKDSSLDGLSETLVPIVNQQPPQDAAPDARIALGKRRAGAAILLLKKGDREQHLAALRTTDDPESLSQFVHRCKDRGVTPKELHESLQACNKRRLAKPGAERIIEDKVLFAILMALGEFPREEVPASESIIDQLIEWYAKDPSATVHGATGWLLRQWGQHQRVKEVDQTPVPYSPARGWYNLEIDATTRDPLLGTPVSKKVFLTFVVVPAGTYRMGSPENDPEREKEESYREIKITRPFAILDREVTWEEATLYNPQTAEGYRNAIQQQGNWKPALDEPWTTRQWYETVDFCRWLTKQAKMQESEQAYPDPLTLDPLAFPADPDRRAGGMPLNWPVSIDRPGFRLATEAEWEVACRIGSLSRWSFGSDAQLLRHYAWFEENSNRRTHSARTKRPNLRGLFDMHGNAVEWCQDWFGDYDSAALENPVGPKNGGMRVCRGGSWFIAGKYCRSAYRIRLDPTRRSNDLGFRIVTVPQK